MLGSAEGKECSQRLRLNQLVHSGFWNSQGKGPKEKLSRVSLWSKRPNINTINKSIIFDALGSPVSINTSTRAPKDMASSYRRA